MSPVVGPDIVAVVDDPLRRHYRDLAQVLKILTGQVLDRTTDIVRAGAVRRFPQAEEDIVATVRVEDQS